MAFTNQDAYLAKKKETVYCKVDEFLTELDEFKSSAGSSIEEGVSTGSHGVDLRPEFATKEVKADEVDEGTSDFDDLSEEIISEPLSDSSVSPESDLNPSVDNLEGQSQKWNREPSEGSEEIASKTLNTEPLNVTSALASQLGVSESALLGVLQSAFGLQGATIPSSASSVVGSEDLNSRTRMSRVESNRANTQLLIKDDNDLREYLLEDIYNYFGDWSRVRKIEVIGRQLYFNGLLYEPDTYKVHFSPEVSMYSVSLWESGGFGELFDWSLVGGYLKPTSLVFDSMDYAFREFDGLSSSSSKEVIEKAFTKYPTLQEMQVGTYSFTRAEVLDMITESQPFLSSYDRRQQVFSRGNSRGRSFRQRRWQKAREHMAEGRTGRAVASALGAGLGVGFQGASHVGGFFNKAARVLRQAGSSVAEDWKEADKSKH